MPLFARTFTFAVATACFALALGASPALAKTHHKMHVKTHHHAKSAKKTNVVVRIAQEHLAHLGYYTGKIDGLMGPKTKTAIKHFQQDHRLKPDGVLGSKTNRALGLADPAPPAASAMPMQETMKMAVPDINPDQAVDQDFAAPLNGGVKTLASRFASLDVNETGAGADKRYLVNLNGHPLLTADDQPAVIGISQTYDLGSEDAIIFTTYNAKNHGCLYENHVLVLTSVGSQILDVANCTRAYQARVDNGSLYISFPEQDDERVLGATWRVEGTRLERL